MMLVITQKTSEIIMFSGQIYNTKQYACLQRKRIERMYFYENWEACSLIYLHRRKRTLINFKALLQCVFLRPSVLMKAFTACVRYFLRLAIVTFELRQLALKTTFGSSGKALH